MRNRPRTLAALLIAGGALCLPGTARTQSEIETSVTEDGKRRVERKVMVVGDDSRKHLIERLPQLKRAFLGVELVNITPELRAHFGVPEDAGVLVGGIVDDSPAFIAGLQVGDVLTYIDGEPVSSAREIQRRIARRDEGDEVALELWRGSERLDLTATLAETERGVLDVGPLFFEELPEGVGQRVIPLHGDGRIVIRRGPGDGLFEVEVDSEDLDRNMAELDEFLEGARRRRGLDEERLEERLEELDRRLRELAEALERVSESQDDG